MPAFAAGVEAGRVRDDQGVLLDGKGSRLGIAHAAQRLARDPERAARAQAVQAAGFHGLAAQPGKAAAVDAVRTGHVDEGSVVRPHIRQEQPGLDRGMEGVGMQLGLRIGLGLAHARQDGLQVVHGVAAERAGVAEQPQPLFSLQHLPQGGHALEHAGVQRHAAGDGVALRHFARLARGPGQLLLHRGQDGRRQEVGLDDESVTVEVQAVLLAQQVSEPSAPEIRHAVSQADARDVQAGPVQPGAADDGIVFEGFGFGRQRQHPHRRPQPAQPGRGKREDGRRRCLGRFLWHVA